MHRRNQVRNLIGTDTILDNIAADDLRNQPWINFLFIAVISHMLYPSVI